MGLAVGAVVLGWWYLGRGKKNNSSQLPSVSPSSKEAANKLVTGTLKAIVAKGVPMKCSYKVNGVEYSGLVKGKQYKGKTKMADGKEGNVLIKGNCMYSWSSEDNQGIKMCFNDSQKSVWDQSGGSMPSTYTCRPALVSDREFNLPAAIKFVDINKMMEGSGVSQ